MELIEQRIHYLFNFLALAAVCFILAFSFYFQLYYHELPCPLCLLQRVCFVAIGMALLMNLRLGLKASHYGLLLLAALLGFAISMRQVLLHIVPGDTGYGLPFLGLHLYTWAALLFLGFIIFTAGALLLERPFKVQKNTQKRGRLLGGCFLILVAINMVSAFFECGLKQCPDNPLHYLLLPK